MKKKFVQIIVFLCMFSFINNLFGQKKVGFTKADEILQKLVRQKKIPGMAVTITKNGEIKWSKGYGYADIKRKISVNPKTTIFRIGSVSKPIAATGLAKMVEKNQINLNDTIYKYVPNFPKKQYSFTLKQLGGHLAGIRNYKGNEFMNKEHLSIREGVALFENDPLLFEPGNDYLYTSYSWNLLSLAMQEAVHKPFEKIIEEEVLRPLKLTNTLPDTTAVFNGKAVFYRKKRKRKFVEVSLVDNFFKLAGGGYLSTSEDVAKLGNAYLNNDFLSKELKEKFVTSQTINNKPTYYGIGWQASFDHKNRAYFGHVGNGLGGYGIFYVYPKEQVVITMLMNCSNPNQDKKLHQVIDAFFEELMDDSTTVMSGS